MRIEITGIAKGYKSLLLGSNGRALSRFVHEAREVGYCKDSPFPIIVARVATLAEIKSKLDLFDEILCIMRWPPGVDG